MKILFSLTDSPKISARFKWKPGRLGTLPSTLVGQRGNSKGHELSKRVSCHKFRTRNWCLQHLALKVPIKLSFELLYPHCFIPLRPAYLKHENQQTIILYGWQTVLFLVKGWNIFREE